MILLIAATSVDVQCKSNTSRASVKCDSQIVEKCAALALRFEVSEAQLLLAQRRKERILRADHRLGA